MGNKCPTVVVVDNSPAIKKLFERSIRDLHVNLEILDTAAESWNFLKNNRPDLLILSIILPDKNGLTLLKELRKLPLHQNTSVIMVSSKNYAQDRLAAEQLGVEEFIPKPIPMQTITDVIVKYTKAKPKSE
jgi:DNA-binding response OmpR family regulator